MDTALFAQASRELAGLAGKLRIERVQERAALFSFSLRGEARRLEIAVGGEYPRFYLSRRPQAFTGQPPAFCMLLRKYLEGSLLTRVEAPAFERWAALHFSAHSHLGDDRPVQLMVEIMGNRSNLVLVGSDGLVLDAYRRSDAAHNPVRPVWPGLPYQPPPAEDKPPPTASTPEAVATLDLKGGPRSLLGAFAGLSPRLSREAWYRSGASDGPPEPAVLARVLRGLGEAIVSPAVDTFLYLSEAGEPAEVSAVPLSHLAGLLERSTDLTTALDTWLLWTETDAARRAGYRELSTWLEREIAWRHLRLSTLEQEGARAQEGLSGRSYGEELLAQPAVDRRGLKSLPSWTAGVEIPLNPEKSLLENAQAYFRRYQRSRRALLTIEPDQKRLVEQLDFLSGLLSNLQQDPSLVQQVELTDALRATGFLPTPKGSPTPSPSALRYRTSGGHTVLVGRNAKENDFLTFRLAAPTDLWFHVQKAPGSHCLLRPLPGQAPAEADLFQAALVAAWHSKLRFSSHVPIDYTERRFVKKVKGGPAGLVTYDRFRTLSVEPSATAVAELLPRSDRPTPVNPE